MFPLPTREQVLEVLMCKSGIVERLKSEAIVLADDAINELSGTISYVEFSQSIVKNRNILNQIYEPVYNKRIF